MACPDCGKDHKRSKNGPCPGCAGARYRSTKEGKKRHAAAKKKYERSEKGKRGRKKYIRAYRLKTGEYIPEDLHRLREANKKLEGTLAGRREGTGEPNEQGGNDGVER